MTLPRDQRWVVYKESIAIIASTLKDCKTNPTFASNRQRSKVFWRENHATVPTCSSHGDGYITARMASVMNAYAREQLQPWVDGFLFQYEYMTLSSDRRTWADLKHPGPSVMDEVLNAIHTHL